MGPGRCPGVRSVSNEDKTNYNEVPGAARSLEPRLLAGQRTATLTVVSGPFTGRWVSVDGQRRAAMIGRDEGAELTLDDPSVSRRHARVYLEAEHGEPQQVVLQDMNSTNGTLHNGQTIDRALLSHGDRVHVGDVLLRFEMLDAIDVNFREQMARRVQDGERDSLTGLFTRRVYDEQLPTILARGAAHNEPVSAVMLDLDHFKRVNDTWGHLVGDDVLRMTGQLVRDAVRRDDLAVRYGGEEILVTLPGARRVHARLLAERLREGIAASRLVSAPDLRVTASLGIAEKDAAETEREWINRADQALYRAKARGRNRTEAAPPPRPITST